MLNPAMNLNPVDMILIWQTEKQAIQDNTGREFSEKQYR